MNRRLQKSLESLNRAASRITRMNDGPQGPSGPGGGGPGGEGPITHEKDRNGLCCVQLTCFINNDDPELAGFVDRFVCVNWTMDSDCNLDMPRPFPYGEPDADGFTRCSIVRTEHVPNTRCIGLNTSCEEIMGKLSHKI